MATKEQQIPFQQCIKHALRAAGVLVQALKASSASTTLQVADSRVPGLAEQLASCEVIEGSATAKQCLSSSCILEECCTILGDGAAAHRAAMVSKLVLETSTMLFESVQPTSKPPDGADIVMSSGTIQGLSSRLVSQCSGGALRSWLSRHLTQQRRQLLQQERQAAHLELLSASDEERINKLQHAMGVLRGVVSAWHSRRAELRSNALKAHRRAADSAYEAWKRTIQQSEVCDAMADRIARASGLWGRSPPHMQRLFQEAGVALPTHLLACSGAAAVAARVPLAQLLTTRGQDIFNRFEDAEATRQFYEAVQRLAVAQRTARDARQQAAAHAAHNAQEQTAFVASMCSIVHALPSRWQAAVLHVLEGYVGLQSRLGSPPPTPPAPLSATLYATCVMWMMLGVPHNRTMAQRWAAAAEGVQRVCSTSPLRAQEPSSVGTSQHPSASAAKRKLFLLRVIEATSMHVQVQAGGELQTAPAVAGTVLRASANLDAMRGELRHRTGERPVESIDRHASVDTMALTRMGTAELHAAVAAEEAQLLQLRAAQREATLHAVTVKTTHLIEDLFRCASWSATETVPCAEWQLQCGDELHTASGSFTLRTLRLPCAAKAPHSAISAHMINKSTKARASQSLSTLLGSELPSSSCGFLLPTPEQLAAAQRLLPAFNKHLLTVEKSQEATHRLQSLCAFHCRVLSAFDLALALCADTSSSQLTKDIALSAGWSLIAQGVIDEAQGLPRPSAALLDTLCSSEGAGQEAVSGSVVPLQQQLAAAVSAVCQEKQHLSVHERVITSVCDCSDAFARVLGHPAVRQQWAAQAVLCQKLLRIHAAEVRGGRAGLPYASDDLHSMRQVGSISQPGALPGGQPAPTPTVDSIGEHSVRISWDAASRDGNLFHVQLRRESALGPSFTNVYLGPDCRVLLNRLQEGSAYMARVRMQQTSATDTWGKWSTVRFHTSLPAPEGLCLSDFEMHCGRAAFSVGVEGGLHAAAASLHLQMSNRSPSPWCAPTSRFFHSFPFETVRLAAADKFEVAWVPPGTCLAFRAQLVSSQGAVSAWGPILQVTVPLPAADVNVSAQTVRWKPAVPLPHAAPRRIQVTSGSHAATTIQNPEQTSRDASAQPKESSLHFNAPDVWFPRLLNIASGAGRFFFVNLKTNQSSFEPAQAAQRTSAQVRGSNVRVRHVAAAAVRIQPQHSQWLVVWDPDRVQQGRQQAYYFYNTETQERSWERPSVPVDAAADSSVQASTQGDWAFGLHSEFVEPPSAMGDGAVHIHSEQLRSQGKGSKQFVLAHEDLQLQTTAFSSTLTQECDQPPATCTATLQCIDSQGQVVQTITTPAQQVPTTELPLCAKVRVRYTVRLGDTTYISQAVSTHMH